MMTDDTLFFSAILLFMHSQLCEKLMYYFVGEKAAFPGFGGGEPLFWCFIYESIALLIVASGVDLWPGLVVCLFRAAIKLLPCLPGTAQQRRGR